MLGVENRTDLRRASLISEIYSETAGPTGGNIGGNVVNTGKQTKDPKEIAKEGVRTLTGHPAFKPKRVTKHGLAKLGKKA